MPMNMKPSIIISSETAHDGNKSTESVLHDNLEPTNNVAQPQVTGRDSEHVLMELMIASSTIPSTGTTKTKSEKASGSSSGVQKSDVKKRAKQQRDNTRELSLLLPESQVVEEEKAFGFAQAYFSKVKDRLDANDFTKFISVLNEFDNRTVKVSELYHNILSILKAHADLSEEFLAFLLPHQAMELGVYMQYLCVAKMKHFLRKIEVYFNKQPQQVRKVYECLIRLVEQSSTEHVDQTKINNAILPLLKGSTVLTEYFLQLFPCEKPTDTECADVNDFENIDCVEFDQRTDASGVHNVDAEADEWETVVIPDLEDPFGGDNCPCSCHSNVTSSVSSHCFSCGVKFINGRVFIQSGKVLRPAQLVVDGPNKREVINRIIAKEPTDVKDFDDKGGGTVRHRKRPAADSSPVKTSTGNNSGVTCALLSPTDIEAENNCDPKPAKIKSPRGCKGVKVLKSNTNKADTTSSKDKIVIEKDRVQQIEEENLVFGSFVLLNDIKNSNNSDDNAKESNVKNMNGNVTIKCEYDEDDDNYIKSKEVANAISSSLLPSDCNEVNLIRDDEDDDVEFIDIDDDDDEVDDDCDDIEEDDHHNDDEEEYEDFDVDDIEEVDMDEEFDREMEVECIDTYKSTHELVNEIQRTCNSEQAKHMSTEIKDDSRKSEDANVTVIPIHSIKKEVVEDDELQEIKLNKTQLHKAPSDTEKETSKDQFSSKMSSFETSTSGDIKSIIKTENVVESPTSTVSSTHATSTTAHLVSWTKEEDKVILQTFQQANDSDQTFVTIRERLPQRSVEEIKSRFHTLMKLLKRMTTNKNNTE